MPNTSLNPALQILSWSAFRSDGSEPLDVVPYLKDRKSIKLMSKQDCLALMTASRAIKEAGLSPEELDRQTGVYLTVGILPFEETHLHTLAENSSSEGRFDMKRFSTDGMSSTNPILTFKCLPNMPLFHISYNLGIHGPYFVTYPGPGQFFNAFEQAVQDLRSGRVEYALVGAVADQENFLVRHHTHRSGVSDPANLRDTACMTVLTLGTSKRSQGKITDFSHSYHPVDPFQKRDDFSERVFEQNFGPAEPLLAIKRALENGEKTLTLKYEDGVQAQIQVESA